MEGMPFISKRMPTLDSCVLEWYDNKVVRLVSSYCGASPTTNLQRWSKKESKYVSVPRPYMIAEYNQNMGGVDKFDMLMAFYRIDRRNKGTTCV